MPLIDLTGGKTPKVTALHKAVEFLGEGSFAEVYRGYHLIKKRDLALKIYKGSDKRTEEIAESEFEILSKLQIFNTDYFPKPEGRPMTMIGGRHFPMVTMELCEYVDGENIKEKCVSLKDIIPDTEQKTGVTKNIPSFWDKEVFFNFIDDMVNAVRLMHKSEVIHRDLKPSNILLKKPSGSDAIKPFLLDFNISVRSGSGSCSGGTENYLPPEVRSEKRKDPKPADDLWAVSVIIWEMMFGLKQNISPRLRPHEFIRFDFPDGLVEILHKALSQRCEERYQNAEEFYKAVHECISCSKTSAVKVIPGEITVAPTGEGLSEGSIGGELTADEIEWANVNNYRIKKDILETLAGANEIPVIKEVKNNVENMYTFVAVSDGETRSLNLKDDVLRLGPDAIPSIIEEGYRILYGIKEFYEIIDALVELSQKNEELAKRSIEAFCSSSDYTVRRICQLLCEKMEYFPTKLIYNILLYPALYSPDERIEIADMCVKYSTSKEVLLPLNQYLCREYILDRNNYKKLKDSIASKIDGLKFKDKAKLIVEDAKNKTWQNLPEYAKLDDDIKREIDNGILQLFADSFASLEDEALSYIKGVDLPIKCYGGELNISRAIITKLVQKYRPARTWLFETIKRTSVTDLVKAGRTLKDLTEAEKAILKRAASTKGIPIDEKIDVEETFRSYLKNGAEEDRNKLRFNCGDETLSLITKKMTSHAAHDEILKILDILKYFKSYKRSRTIGILCDHWNKFSQVDYKMTVTVVSHYEIPAHDKDKVLKLLSKDLEEPGRKKMAREGINSILSRD